MNVELQCPSCGSFLRAGCPGGFPVLGGFVGRHVGEYQAGLRFPGALDGLCDPLALRRRGSVRRSGES